LLPQDVLVLTRQEFSDMEGTYWARRAAIGFIFDLGAVMGLLVGAVIVYQILYTDVTDHLDEYATLKAMGFTTRYLFSVVPIGSFFTPSSPPSICSTDSGVVCIRSADVTMARRALSARWRSAQAPSERAAELIHTVLIAEADDDARTVLAVPIVDRERRLVAVAEFLDRKGGGPFTPADRERAERLAGSLGSVLERCVRLQPHTDRELVCPSGLVNRRRTPARGDQPECAADAAADSRRGQHCDAEEARVN
jgi:hypothetical protein